VQPSLYLQSILSQLQYPNCCYESYNEQITPVTRSVKLYLLMTNDRKNTLAASPFSQHRLHGERQHSKRSTTNTATTLETRNGTYWQPVASTIRSNDFVLMRFAVTHCKLFDWCQFSQQHSNLPHYLSSNNEIWSNSG